MTLRIGINGFGRIGRVATRILFENERFKNQDLEIVAINDLTDTATLAHLLQFDSVHGRFSKTVSVEDGAFIVDGKRIRVTAEKDPTKLDWKSVGADLILECTGRFRTKEQASIHIDKGAKKVIISAPADDPDITIAYGVNHTHYDPAKHNVLSCASCTTNCLAPVAKVLLEAFGIERGTMTTIHSYTNDQSILDLPHKDLRRCRAAALSMIPTSTGAAKAVGLVLPALKGKVDGLAIRVPTPNVSVCDFVAELSKKATKEEINAALKKAADGELRGILQYTDLPLVSVDFNGSIASSTVDSQCTLIMNGSSSTNSLAKVIAWYDNESGFSARMLDMAAYIAKQQ